ncbi:AbaSI family restriction endonuclease, partial [Fructilactobacillus sanfranciscensis]
SCLRNQLTSNTKEGQEMVQVEDSKWPYLLSRLHEQSHKQRESFVINFILMNLLSDDYTDVNPVLQQPVEQDPVSGKREAIDLYFPHGQLSA